MILQIMMGFLTLLSILPVGVAPHAHHGYAAGPRMRTFVLLAAIVAHQGARGVNIMSTAQYQSCLANTATCAELYARDASECNASCMSPTAGDGGEAIPLDSTEGG